MNRPAGAKGYLDIYQSMRSPQNWKTPPHLCLIVFHNGDIYWKECVE